MGATCSTASIRPASEGDLLAIRAIMNEAIVNTTASWREDPYAVDEMERWHASRKAVLVAVDSRRVLGFASFGSFRSQSGFRHTVEHALYVDRSAQRRGIGRILLGALEVEARSRDLHMMVGAISSDNPASLALHLACGFSEVGRMPQSGRKFDRWLDLVLVQKML